MINVNDLIEKLEDSFKQLFKQEFEKNQTLGLEYAKSRISTDEKENIAVAMATSKQISDLELLVKNHAAAAEQLEQELRVIAADKALEQARGDIKSVKDDIIDLKKQQYALLGVTEKMVRDELNGDVIAWREQFINEGKKELVVEVLVEKYLQQLFPNDNSVYINFIETDLREIILREIKKENGLWSVDNKKIIEGLDGVIENSARALDELVSQMPDELKDLPTFDGVIERIDKTEEAIVKMQQAEFANKFGEISDALLVANFSNELEKIEKQASERFNVAESINVEEYEPLARARLGDFGDKFLQSLVAQGIIQKEQVVSKVNDGHRLAGIVKNVSENPKYQSFIKNPANQVYQQFILLQQQITQLENKIKELPATTKVGNKVTYRSDLPKHTLQETLHGRLLLANIEYEAAVEAAGIPRSKLQAEETLKIQIEKRNAIVSEIQGSLLSAKKKYEIPISTIIKLLNILESAPWIQAAENQSKFRELQELAIILKAISYKNPNEEKVSPNDKLIEFVAKKDLVLKTLYPDVGSKDKKSEKQLFNVRENLAKVTQFEEYQMAVILRYLAGLTGDKDFKKLDAEVMKKGAVLSKFLDSQLKTDPKFAPDFCAALKESIKAIQDQDSTNILSQKEPRQPLTQNYRRTSLLDIAYKTYESDSPGSSASTNSSPEPEKNKPRSF